MKATADKQLSKPPKKRSWRYEQTEGTSLFTTPKHNSQGTGEKVHTPLVDAILGRHAGVSIHRGVILVFPIM